MIDNETSQQALVIMTLNGAHNQAAPESVVGQGFIGRYIGGTYPVRMIIDNPSPLGQSIPKTITIAKRSQNIQE
jgi:hypothetical protein